MKHLKLFLAGILASAIVATVAWIVIAGANEIERAFSNTHVLQEHSVYWISEDHYTKVDGYGNTHDVILLSYSLDGEVQLPVECRDKEQVEKYMAWVEKRYRRAP